MFEIYIYEGRSNPKLKCAELIIDTIENNYLVEPRAQEPGHLLDQGVRGEEGVVALGKLLDLLLVLVQLLQVLGTHEGDA